MNEPDPNKPRYDGGAWTTVGIIIVAIFLIFSMILGLVFLNVGVAPDREICSTIYGAIHPNCFNSRRFGESCFIGYNCSQWSPIGTITCCNGVCVEKDTPFGPCPY